MSKAGEVQVEGAYVGRLDGFRFVPDATDGATVRTLSTAANRVLRAEVAARARRLATDADDAFAIDADGELRWRGGAVGRLVAGETLLAPRVEVLAGDFLEGEARERVRQRLQAFCRERDRAPPGAAFRGAGLPLDGSGAAWCFSWSTRSAACRRRGRRRRGPGAGDRTA